MTLSKINIYKIFHIENIPHILANGITHKSSPNRNPNFVAIGDKSMIAQRNERQVNITNGANNIIESTTKPEDIVYVACSVQAIVDSNLIYYFSDGHAADYLSTFYNKNKINRLPQIVDWYAAKQKLIKFGVNNPIKVIPKAYY